MTICVLCLLVIYCILYKHGSHALPRKLNTKYILLVCANPELTHVFVCAFACVPAG